jgi:hypothetical protein
LVTNRISSLEKEIRQLLEQNYPGTDFDACLIIQEGRKPYSRVGLFAQGAGSALALLAAIGLFVAIRRKKPALRAARNIPAATAQVEPTLYYPGNDPQLADFFVPPPEEIGEILTAHTTLLKTKNPKSFMLRGLIGVVAGVGPCLILTLVTWLAWRLPAEAVIVIFVMSALLITPWTVVGAFYFTRFRHACRYVGDKGVARFTCARSRQRPKVSDRFLFSEADELRVWEDRCDQNGAIHTRYNFTWTDSEGNKVFVIKGNYQAKEDIPPKEDNYHFALASDWAWCEHLLDIILPVLRAGKEYFFRLHGDDGINCQSKFVEIHRNGEVQRLYPTDLAGVEIKDGTIWIMEPESKEGSFTSTGVHRFSFDKLANARAFLGVLREVYAVSLESRV